MISCIANSTVLTATLVRTCATAVPTTPSTDDKQLYPDVNTFSAYNHLDRVIASGVSNFPAPYLLLRCQNPNDVVHYGYRTSSRPPNRTPPLSNPVVQHVISLSQQQARLLCLSVMEILGFASSKCPTSASLALLHPASSATISRS